MSSDFTKRRHPPEVLTSFKRFFDRKSASKNDLELHQSKSSPSTSTAPQELAVCVRDVHKNYGSGKNSSVVLDGLNMTVFKGTIYALLGASGCGKTTLLSCILGCRKHDSGQIWILGGPPGSKASGTPGPRVGYMPQETALFVNFTIDEIFSFYGWIAGMTSKVIKKRGGFLKELFMLPDTKQLVGTLSGGQQRRVSLAAVLLHEPELLVLDEPTVGLDPLLRETIWQHFLDLTKENTTIILTTHYVEEARLAHTVGLMRRGRLLAEEPPQRLVKRHGGTTLEDVFFKLSTQQDRKLCLDVDGEVANNGMQSVNEAKAIDVEVSYNVGDETLHYAEDNVPELHLDEDVEKDALPTIPPQDQDVCNLSVYLPAVKRNHLKALVWKMMIFLVRNSLPLFCAVMLPVSQVPIFCLAIGGDPVDLQVAVVNYETNNTVNCNTTLTCDSSQLSCSYLGYLERRGLNLVYYDFENDARRSVLSTQSYAAIVVRHNYSAALRVRLDDWYGVELWDIESSEIDVIRDVSNKQVAMQLKLYLYDTFISFIQDLAESCGLNKRVLNTPINVEQPIYGLRYSSYTDFVVPGLLVNLTFFLGSVVMACSLIIDRRELNFDRAYVMGITDIELIIAQFVGQLIPIICQTALSIICAFLIFNVTQNGSYAVLMANLLMSGFLGMCFGMFISCVCDREATAMLVALGSIAPMMILDGAIWCVEALHPLLQPISYILPLTKALSSFRSIAVKGWGFSSEVVYMSFVSLSIWGIVLLITGLVFLKYKKG